MHINQEYFKLFLGHNVFLLNQVREEEADCSDCFFIKSD